jgi:hypothetical protein
MIEVINTLQTLASALTLMVQIFVLIGIVYAFRRCIKMFNALMEDLEAPKVNVATSTTTTTTLASASDRIVILPEAVPVKIPEIKRYKCKCKAKLPETPEHSVIENDVTFLVFKCGRCGKDTKIDPSKD